MSRRNTSGRYARSGSIRACCQPKPVTPSRFLSGALEASSLLRGLLGHCWLVASHRGAAHVAGLRLVVAADTVHGLAIVPHHKVMLRPLVDVDEFRSGCVLGQVPQ